MIFDDFQSALEEAVWCAKDEQKIYIIRCMKGRFKVTPKHRMQKYYSHIEVGFKNVRV
tara:strand:- start:2825 stop:2998 length:174 start_codon:yes stop_codon:yes gene_type:complete